MIIAFTIVWVVWLLIFAVTEALALMNDMPGDTFSEHVKKWLRTDTHIGRTIFLVAWSIFGIWFLGHIEGWWP